MVGEDSFLKGLVFGFDLGTGSIGYAVRKGNEFKDVGVLICPEDTSKLDVRRGSRSQRRRLTEPQPCPRLVSETTRRKAWPAFAVDEN